jgi:hypothetical protein
MTVPAPTNVLVCVGCDSYDRSAELPTLRGAERDATSVFDLLAKSALYAPGVTHLLHSPTIGEIRDCIGEVAKIKNLGVLTFYFAGHGEFKVGTFYLCLRDSDVERLSTTAIAISYLFTVAGEMRPRQVNFIVDACKAGGAVVDVSVLTKTEVMGEANSSSIAFLASCGADQYAEESDAGGAATMELVKYLNGEKIVQSVRPYLDLVEVGLAVSRDVGASSVSQTPTSWGLNLYGDGQFCLNPHFSSTGGSIYIPGIAPNSTAGAAVRKIAESLREQLQAIQRSPNAAALAAMLDESQGQLGEDYLSFIGGFATAISASASKSDDLLASSESLYVCAASLLPRIDAPEAQQVCREILGQLAKFDMFAIESLCATLDRSKFALLANGSALSEFHYLPLRVSRILAWLALARFTADMVGGVDDMAAKTNQILSHILDTYRESIVAVAEDQAPWAYIFSKLAHRYGWAAQSVEVLDRLYASALVVQGNFLDSNARGEEACQYTLLRAGLPSELEKRSLANPTELLAVILLLGSRASRNSEWDGFMKVVDGKSVNMYVPDDYLRFSERIMPGGNNFTNRVGHSFWTLAEFLESSQVPLKMATAASAKMNPLGILLCAYSAYIRSDRVPYCLT